MKGKLSTIHYHPLQTISFPTALLSETILFIDGKISNKQEGGGQTKSMSHVHKAHKEAGNTSSDLKRHITEWFWY